MIQNSIWSSGCDIPYSASAANPPETLGVGSDTAPLALDAVPHKPVS